MANQTVKKGAIAALVLALGGIATLGVFATEPKLEESEKVDTRPTIAVQSANAENYQISLTGYGEVLPAESTVLSPQVSGEVIHWSENFVEGGLVSRGEVLFSIERDAYEAALLNAEANLLSAQSRLIEEKARADAAAEEAKSLKTGSVTDLYLRKPQLLSAQAAVKSAQSALKIAQRDLDNCQVVAPFDAVVVSRNIGMGQMLMGGTRVAQLHNVERAEITFPVANFDRQFLSPSMAGQNVEIKQRGISRVVYQGKITRDSGVVQSGTRMLNLVAVIDDPYGIRSGKAPMYFGTYASVHFNGIKVENVYRVPQELIINNRIWVVEEDKIFSREVSVVREERDFSIVRSALKENEKIAISLPEFPQEGMEVIVGETASATVAMTREQ